MESSATQTVVTSNLASQSLLLNMPTVKPIARGKQECPGCFYEEESFTNYYAQVCHLLKHKSKSCNTQSVFTTMNHDVLAEMIHQLNKYLILVI
jgi:hypothetical protein